MTYAIVKISGKQYRVSEGDTLLVNKLVGEKGKEYDFGEVYLVKTDSQIKVGQPLVSDVSVKAVIEAQLKGEKIDVSKFKSKVRYRRKMGFRPLLTKIKITKIKTGGKETEKIKEREKRIKRTNKK